MSAASQQQPVVVYPNTVTGQQHNHSNGSFGTVFIVLAVIVAISAVACFLGRLCNRRYHKQRPNREAHPQAHNKLPEQPREGDIEFGNQSRIQPETQKFRIRPRDEDMNIGGGMEQMRNPREGGAEFGGFEPREGGGGMEFGLDKRVPSGRLAGDGGGIVRGFNPSESGEVHRFGGGEPRAGGAYDHA